MHSSSHLTLQNSPLAGWKLLSTLRGKTAATDDLYGTDKYWKHTTVGESTR